MMVERMFTWSYLCDTCARLIEYEPGDFVIQDAWYCPRLQSEKLAFNDMQNPYEVCPRYEQKGGEK